MRIHATLVVAVVLAAGAAVQAASFEVGLAVAVFVASLVLHEVAHAFAAWRLGGEVGQIILAPVGGIHFPGRSLVDPESRVFVAMAGPMANLFAVVVAVMSLAAWGQPADTTLFFPRIDASLSPMLGGQALGAGEPAVAMAKMAIWINWPLFVLNMLPAFPFDGAEAGRSLLAPWVGSATAAEIVGRLALIAGGVLLVVAPVLQGRPGAWPAPSTLAASLGVLVCFGSYRDRSLARSGRLFGVGVLPYPTDGAGYALSEGEWGDEEDDEFVVMEVGTHAGHVGPPNAPHPKGGEYGDEAYDERRLDEVLAKLHRSGMDGLTAAERGVLRRASDRLRHRKAN